MSDPEDLLTDITSLLETRDELHREIERLHFEIFLLRRKNLDLATALERVEKERDEAETALDSITASKDAT